MKKISIFIAFHAYLMFVIMSLLVVDVTVIPILISLLFVKPVWKMMSRLSENEINQIFGLHFLKSISDNPVIQDIDKE